MNEDQLKELLKPDEYQVFLFTCRATLPFSFGRHPWLVVNEKGKISRWEVFWRPQNDWPERWGHIHKNFYSPTEGISKYFFSEKYLWKKGTKLLGHVEGDMAQNMIKFIETSPKTYPYSNRYSLKGPNSGTYIQWILERFPESKLRLPWNSFGKGYKSI